MRKNQQFSNHRVCSAGTFYRSEDRGKGVSSCLSRILPSSAHLLLMTSRNTTETLPGTLVPSESAVFFSRDPKLFEGLSHAPTKIHSRNWNYLSLSADSTLNFVAGSLEARCRGLRKQTAGTNGNTLWGFRETRSENRGNTLQGAPEICCGYLQKRYGCPPNTLQVTSRYATSTSKNIMGSPETHCLVAKIRGRTVLEGQKSTFLDPTRKDLWVLFRFCPLLPDLGWGWSKLMFDWNAELNFLIHPHLYMVKTKLEKAMEILTKRVV